MSKIFGVFKKSMLAVFSVVVVFGLLVDLYHHLTDACRIRNHATNDVVLDDIDISFGTECPDSIAVGDAVQYDFDLFRIYATGAYELSGPDLLGVDSSGTYTVRENGEWRTPRPGEVARYWGTENPISHVPGTVLGRVDLVEF